MGYTNYINQKRSFTDEEWEQIKKEFEYLKECFWFFKFFVCLFVSSLYPYKFPHKGGIVVSRLAIMVYVNGVSL